MRSIDERMGEVFKRASAREAGVRAWRRRAVALAGMAVSAAVIVFVGVSVASVPGEPNAAGASGQLSLMGSVLADGSALGYVVVGLLGLVLGAAVTLLAIRFGRPASGSEEPRAHGKGRMP